MEIGDHDIALRGCDVEVCELLGKPSFDNVWPGHDVDDVVCGKGSGKRAPVDGDSSSFWCAYVEVSRLPIRVVHHVAIVLDLLWRKVCGCLRIRELRAKVLEGFDGMPGFEIGPGEASQASWCGHESAGLAVALASDLELACVRLDLGFVHQSGGFAQEVGVGWFVRANGRGGKERSEERG